MSSTATRPAGDRQGEKHPVDQILPAPKLAIYGFQHVLAFYAGAVIVPILLASAIHLTPAQLAYLINADLFTCGIASIIQSVGFWKIGVRLPLLQGVTFSAVTPMISIGLAQGGGVPGLRAIYGSVIVGGVFAFLIAPFFAKIIRFFPPIVTGTVITIIGVTLLSVAALDFGGGGGSQATNPPTFGEAKNLALAGFTLLVILLIYRFSTGFLSTVAVLIGLLVGTTAGAIFGFTDFSHVGDAANFGVTTPFHFGTPTFKIAACVSMIIVMLITAVETTGDVFACAEIVEKPVGGEDIARALRADGLATFLGGILNSFPYTCFAENVGLVRLTKVKSRFVVATAGAIMIVIGVLPKVGAVVAAIPPPVLGGAGFALFGTVAVIGIQTLRRVDFHKESNVIILAISLAFAIAPTVYPTIVSGFSEGVRTVVSSGITLGSISAIVLNLVFNVWGGTGGVVSRVLPVPRHEDILSLDQVNQMSRQQFVDEFGRLFQGPPRIAEQAYDARPFADAYELRKAFLDVLFGMPEEDQLELIRSYPDLGHVAEQETGTSALSIADQAFAGLDRLDTDEHTTFDSLTKAYKERFGFPLIIAVRENTKETILRTGNARLQNAPSAERAAALVEIAKISNLRLLDIVETPDVESAGQR